MRWWVAAFGISMAACGGAPVVEPVSRLGAAPAAPLPVVHAPVVVPRRVEWVVQIPNAWDLLHLVADAAQNTYVSGACSGEADPSGRCVVDGDSFVTSFDAAGRERWRTELHGGVAVTGLAFSSGGALGIVLEQDGIDRPVTATASTGVASAPMRFARAAGRAVTAAVRLDPATGAVLGSVVPHPPTPILVRDQRTHRQRVLTSVETVLRYGYGFPSLVADPRGLGWVLGVRGVLSRVDEAPAFVSDVDVDPATTLHAIGGLAGHIVTLDVDATLLDARPVDGAASTLEARAVGDRVEVVLHPADGDATSEFLGEPPQLVTGAGRVFVVGRYRSTTLLCGEHRLDAVRSLYRDGFVAAFGVDGRCRWLRAISTSYGDAAFDGVAMADGSVIVAAVRGDAFLDEEPFADRESEEGAAHAEADRVGTIYLMRFASDGAPLGERALGVAGLGRGPRGVALAPDGDLFVLVHTDRPSRAGELSIPRGVVLMRTVAP